MKHEKEGQLGEECEEKKDWEEELSKFYGCMFESGDYDALVSFIREKLKEEREKWRLKNAGFYRQLFGEMRSDKYFTARELWKMFAEYAPLFTEEQKKELKDNLYNSIMKGDGNK